LKALHGIDQQRADLIGRDRYEMDGNLRLIDALLLRALTLRWAAIAARPIAKAVVAIRKRRTVQLGPCTPPISP
jgi:hypothetical protein